MPTRFDNVAAQMEAEILPRAIDVKAIELCTVEGRQHKKRKPSHNGFESI